MPLDHDVCWRAIASRDARFDGRFFTGVLTTGIYCRPSCPSRTPLARNVRFFAHAAAAETAGLRACKRCRPDRAPGVREVRSDLVGRAVALVEEGVVDTDGVPGVAERLAVSERHLRRVMREELGAGPLEVARHRRTRLAAALLETGDLPVGEVAFASGFGSVRQFNDEVLRATGRTPVQVRAAAGGSALPGLALRLPARPPFDGAEVLRWLAERTVSGLDAVADGTWQRTVPGGLVSVTPEEHGVLVRVAVQEPRTLGALVHAVRRVWDVDADPVAIGEVLRRDRALRPLVDRWPAVRVPGAWSPWEGLLRTIVGQQVSVAAARTLLARIVAATGGLPSPEQLLGLADLARTVGMPASRAETLRSVARVALTEGLSPETRTGVSGVGPWTMGYATLRAFHDPDALPAGDLVLRRAAARIGVDLADGRPMWRPWRSYACQLLWQQHAHRQSTAAQEEK
jgi:AraC family transcriptional regulator of adaptative response / DNA-3-methyladenine glycosylase II